MSQNIPENEPDGRNVAALYAARWDIENLMSPGLFTRHFKKKEKRHYLVLLTDCLL